MDTLVEIARQFVLFALPHGGQAGARRNALVAVCANEQVATLRADAARAFDSVPPDTRVAERA